MFPAVFARFLEWIGAGPYRSECEAVSIGRSFVDDGPEGFDDEYFGAVVDFAEVEVLRWCDRGEGLGGE